MTRLAVCTVLLALVTLTKGQTACNLDIALAIDTSGSIAIDSPGGNVQNWVDIINFLLNLVDGFTIGSENTRVAAVTFASAAELEFDLNNATTAAELRSNIQALTYPKGGGTTNTRQALEIVRTQIFNSSRGDRPNADNLVFLFTDGKPNPYNEAQLNNTIDLLKAEDNPQIIGVSVGSAVNNETMAKLTDTFFSVKNFSQLNSTVASLIAAACPPAQDLICPAPVETYAFAAYTRHFTGTIPLEIGSRIGFGETFSNLGGHYNTADSVFTCPCGGYYEFSVAMSGVDHGPAVAIVRDDVVVSALAYLLDDGAMSTATIIPCMEGQRVWVELMFMHENGGLRCSLDSYSINTFLGKLITTF